jgi:hypothetical protein
MVARNKDAVPCRTVPCNAVQGPCNGRAKPCKSRAKAVQKPCKSRAMPCMPLTIGFVKQSRLESSNLCTSTVQCRAMAV